MAASVQTFPNLNIRSAWLWQFLKDELAPYTGRKALVARTVIASTLVMIVSMTFRLPYGALGAIWAFVLSHENLETTAKDVRGMVIGLLLSSVYIVLGLAVALADPVLRFLWITVGFLLALWEMSAFSRYSLSGRAGYLMVVTSSIWDSHISAESKLESILWAAGVISMAGVVAWLVHLAFEAFHKSNPLVEGIAEELSAVEELLGEYLTGRPVNASTSAELTRLAMKGTSRLRQMLHRSGFDPQYPEQMGAVVALSGRLVDLAANLAEFAPSVPDGEYERIGRLASRIREIREDLTRGSVPRNPELGEGNETPASLPLLSEMEQTVSLIYEAFTQSTSLSVFAPSPAPGVPTSFARADLLDSRHIKFALRGCMAATASYVAFNALHWPEISTSVTTCFLTALTTIGASRQKQVLRFAGALIGCFALGMGAQIFVLPYIDSIAGLTALFIPVTVAAAWIATSSPRLAYLGVQVAVGFDLVNLQEFRFNTSLYDARDRACGIFLGLLMMWVFFDQLWSTPAGVLMRRTFVSTLRLLAQLARQPLSRDVRTAVERSYALRETINSNFDQVRAQADAVLFEFGASRRRDLEFRERILEWGPRFRTLFIMRIAALKYELQTPGFAVPEAVRLRQKAYDELSARVLEQLADHIEGRAPDSTPGVELHESLTKALENVEAASSREMEPAKGRSLITLLRAIDDLTSRLAEEMAADFSGL